MVLQSKRVQEIVDDIMAASFAVRQSKTVEGRKL
jgi:hypothetical protein